MNHKNAINAYNATTTQPKLANRVSIQLNSKSGNSRLTAKTSNPVSKTTTRLMRSHILKFRIPNNSAFNLGR